MTGQPNFDERCGCGHTRADHDRGAGDSRCLVTADRADLNDTFDNGRADRLGYCACLRFKAEHKHRGASASDVGSELLVGFTAITIIHPTHDELVIGEITSTSHRPVTIDGAYIGAVTFQPTRPLVAQWAASDPAGQPLGAGGNPVAAAGLVLAAWDEPEDDQ